MLLFIKLTPIPSNNKIIQSLMKWTRQPAKALRIFTRELVSSIIHSSFLWSQQLSLSKSQNTKSQIQFCVTTTTLAYVGPTKKLKDIIDNESKVCCYYEEEHTYGIIFLTQSCSWEQDPQAFSICKFEQWLSSFQVLTPGIQKDQLYLFNL